MAARPGCRSVRWRSRASTPNAGRSSRSALLDEADDLFERSGSDSDAGFFYNAIATTAALPAISGHADELLDRSVLALARVAGRVESGCSAAPAVTSLFGGPRTGRLRS